MHCCFVLRSRRTSCLKRTYSCCCPATRPARRFVTHYYDDHVNCLAVSGSVILTPSSSSSVRASLFVFRCDSNPGWKVLGIRFRLLFRIIISDQERSIIIDNYLGPCLVLWPAISVLSLSLLQSEHRAHVCCVHQAYCHSHKDSVSLHICHCIINCCLLFTCPPILSASTACLYGVGQVFATEVPLLQLRPIYHAVQYEMRCVFCNCAYIHHPNLLSSSSSYVTRVSQDPPKLPALIPATRTPRTLR